jgi:hypothetical protein
MKSLVLLCPVVLLLPLLGACAVPDAEPDDASSSPSDSSPSAAASASTPMLNAILGELRVNTSSALTKYANLRGWPVPVEGGSLFVSTDPSLPRVAGDHDNWAGTLMKPDAGFFWVVLPVANGNRYKFTNKSIFRADPFARSYNYDSFGEISLVRPTTAHLDRFVAIGDAKMKPRPLHIWVPAPPITRVLYVHDGQNLFDPNASFGSWHLQDSALPGMLMVGIDNTSNRMDEYTQVPDVIDGGAPLGGKGDAYADFLKNTVRPLIRTQYGEPGPIGVMGSSLGGLISLHIADREPGAYAFAASLSGTVGWGSIGAGVHNQTMIERYKAHGHRSTVLYLDSGGSGACFDSDNDGINDDDPNAHDNFCENNQLRDALFSLGYQANDDLFHWWEPGAQHNEAAWGARVFRPLAIFNGL